MAQNWLVLEIFKIFGSREKKSETNYKNINKQKNTGLDKNTHLMLIPLNSFPKPSVGVREVPIALLASSLESPT